ncbi:hypothetical protein BBJ28_00012043 [Nothophytophthora sp. Chile5]|nr:hypothetical protein BBJ28_00012043 [Nothophytophthora sp. Chile5]
MEVAEADRRAEKAAKMTRKKEKVEWPTATRTFGDTWRSLTGRLGRSFKRLKNRVVTLLVCCAHATASGGRQPDAEDVDNAFQFLDGGCALSSPISSGKAADNDAATSCHHCEEVIPLHTAIPPTPRHCGAPPPSQFEEDACGLVDSDTASVAREELKEVENGEAAQTIELEEEDKAFLTPRLRRAQRGFSDTVYKMLEEGGSYMHKNRDPTEEHESVCSGFKRVRLSLKPVLAVKKLIDERKEASSHVIQRAWRKHRHRKAAIYMKEVSMPLKTEALVKLKEHAKEAEMHCHAIEEARAVPSSSSPCPDDEDLQQDAFFDCVLAESSMLLSKLQEHEDAIAAKSCVSSLIPALPATSEAPSAPTSRERPALNLLRAARILQLFWRRKQTKQHEDTLRRMRLYEEESKSAMPTIRSQMSVVRQRLDELRRSRGGAPGPQVDDGL